MSTRRGIGALATLLLAASLAVAGCGSVEGDAGSADIGVSTQALSSADVTKVTITISGANISPNIVHDLNKTGGQWKGVINHIPVGTGRTFLAQAYNSSSTLVYEGSATGVTITKGAPVTVVILLQQKTAPTPFANSSPYISALTASSTAVGPSETVSLAVTASDPDTGDTLTYAWTDDCSGSFATASSASPTWTAPATAGTCTLSVTVSDGNGAQVGLSLSVGVQTYYSRGTANVSVSFNTWPDVTQVAANPGHVTTGGSVSLTTTAADNDGDTLSYAWSDGSCGGSFSSTSTASPTWTAPATAPAAGTCTLTVTVTDGNGGTNTGAVTVKVGTLATANVAPVVDSSFQSVSALSETSADTVTLRVVASDPESQALTFSWSAGSGTLGTQTDTGSGPYTSENTLTTAGACTASITVTVTVSDGVNSTAHPFTLTCPWAAPAHGSGSQNVVGAAIAMDGSGGMWVAGHFQGTATFGATTLTSAGGYDIFVARLDSAGRFVSASRAGGIGNDYATSMAVDGSGNVHIAGVSDGSVTFGSTTLTNAGSYDLYVARVNSAGSFVSAAYAGSSGTDYAMAIAVDSSGNVHVTGYYTGSITFGSLAALSNAGSEDIFVARLDSAGTWTAATRAGSTGTDRPYSIAVDSSGNAHIAGRFSSYSLPFGSTTLTRVGNDDAFVARLDSAGTWASATRAGGTNAYAQGTSLALDGSGNVHVTGSFTNQATFGSTTLTSAGDRDIFVARLDSAGTWVSAVRAGGTGYDLPYSIAVASSGDVYVSGSFTSSSLVFGSTTLTTAGVDDIYVARLNSAGTWVSAVRAGGSGNDYPAVNGLVLDASGNPYITGKFQSTASFGSTTLTSAGSSDMYVWRP